VAAMVMDTGALTSLEGWAAQNQPIVRPSENDRSVTPLLLKGPKARPPQIGRDA
jgi:hypothetical protein